MRDVLQNRAFEAGQWTDGNFNRILFENLLVGNCANLPKFVTMRQTLAKT